MSERTITSLDGTHIAYEQDGSGPSLVLVHGGFVDRTFWGPSVPLLTQHFTVYAMDRRGHGASGDYPAFSAEWTLEREYEDVLALLATLGEPVTLLGHSSGARVALHAARRSPQVSRLVLYEPPLLGPVAPEILVSLHAALAAGDADSVVSAALGDVIGAASNPALPAEARAQLLAGMRQSPVWAGALRNVRSIPAEVESYSTYRFDPAEFRDFATPTVLLLGSTSGLVMRRWVEGLQAALPCSRITMLEGQGHGAMREAPEVFVHTVQQALDWMSTQD
jgi:pimeloyl-ACP methyl ester carboxylesterase